MDKLNIAICEDQTDDTQSLLEQIKEAGVPCDAFAYQTGEEFLDSFKPGFFQLVFLDIYLDEQKTAMTGVDVAKKIRETDKKVWIVFTTVSHDHAIESYGVEAAGYLPKPLETEKLTALLTKAQQHRKDFCREITVTVDRKQTSIAVNDILYIEVYGKDTLIHMQKDTVVCHTTIEELELVLPSLPFLRCHRSYIVNMDYIESVDRDFYMANGDKVYIGRNGQWEVKRAYRDYIVHLARRRSL